MGMIWDIGYPLSNLSKNEYFQFSGFYVTGFHVIPKLLLYKPANMYSGFGGWAVSFTTLFQVNLSYTLSHNMCIYARQAKLKQEEEL